MSEMLADKKMAPKKLGRVLVLGLGTSGNAVVKYCLPLLGTRIDALCIAAGKETDASRATASEFRAAGAQVAFGEDCVPELAQLAGGRFNVCIASPGISERFAFYQSAAAVSDEVIAEVEFAWRESAADAKWVAITGTNGKTTTTALTAHLLQGAGMAASAVGNIGDTCISAVAAGNTQVYVAEVSSYQLASTRNFAPNVAVLLNITPDHLHWHGTLEAYRDAKFKLLANLAQVSAGGRGASDGESASQKGAVAILDATNDVVRAKVRELKGMCADERGFAYVPFGTADGIEGDMRAKCGSENAAFLGADGALHVALGVTEHVLCLASDLQIPGAHNVSNALAAAAAAIAAGASDEVVIAGLKSFAPLEHRIEPCGSVNGAACYNDSKATNVDATLKALAAFPSARPIVLLGGDDKGTDLADLVREAHKHTRAVVCFGAAGPRFYEAFAAAAAEAPAGFQLLQAQHMEDALDTALGVAREGDVVLLSPACASFDEFSCFEQRGDVFKQLVAARSGEQA